MLLINLFSVQENVINSCNVGRSDVAIIILVSINNVRIITTEEEGVESSNVGARHCH